MLPISTLKSIFEKKQLRLSAIVASASNHVIGYKEKMPWHCPADLARFKQLTLKKHVMMGRKTMESIGHPLPGRHIAVLSRSNERSICGCPVISDLETWFQGLTDQQEIMVAGGAQIYTLLLPLCTTVYQTIIEHDFPGDTIFPPLDPSVWKVIHAEFHPADQKNRHNYRFLQYESKLI